MLTGQTRRRSGPNLPSVRGRCASFSLPRPRRGVRRLEERHFLHSKCAELAFPKEALAHFCPGQEVAADRQGDETVQRCSSLVLYMKDESQ